MWPCKYELCNFPGKNGIFKHHNIWEIWVHWWTEVSEELLTIIYNNQGISRVSWLVLCSLTAIPIGIEQKVFRHCATCPEAFHTLCAFEYLWVNWWHVMEFYDMLCSVENSYHPRLPVMATTIFFFEWTKHVMTFGDITWQTMINEIQFRKVHQLQKLICWETWRYVCRTSLME